MKIKFLLTISIVFIQTFLGAQAAVESNPKPKKVYNGPSGHALGAVLSSTNGKGLAYRYWPKNLGFHLSFFPAANNDSKYYNGGITGYMSIREYEIGTLFLHAGVEYQYTSRLKYETTNYPTYTSIGYRDNTDGLNIGIGPGLHVMQKYVSMDIFLGYGAYFRDHSSTLTNHVVKDEMTMTLSGGIAFFLEL